jgi:hypothetical protein
MTRAQSSFAISAAFLSSAMTVDRLARVAIAGCGGSPLHVYP